MIAAAPTLPTLPPARAPATMAPTPAKSATTEAVCAVASCSRSRCKWPPAKWPVSCANTPMISFGVRASNSAPALMKMWRPSMTKALKARSLSTTTLTFCLARPAARRIGAA